MRHYKKGRKLGTDASHTKAMKKSLVAALLKNDRIKTIESRAKEIRPDVDKVITWAKRGDLHSRRLAIAKVGDKELVREVFEKAAQGMWADRNGGYTRIMKLGPRKGDNAPMVIMELVTEPCVPKAKREEELARQAAKARAEKAKENEAKAEEAEEEATETEAEAAETEAEAAETEAETAEAEAAEAPEAEAEPAAEEAAPAEEAAEAEDKPEEK